MTLQEETPVQVLQDETEFRSLLDIYDERQPTTVLEIGVHVGGTLYHWISRGRWPRSVTAVDLSFRDGRAEMFEDWSRQFDAGLTLIEGDSTYEATIARVEAKAPFDWLFIDGDHEYAGALADWRAYRWMVEEGGIVAFHDIARWRNGTTVDKLWDEIRASGDYRTMEFVEAGANVGIGVVYL